MSSISLQQSLFFLMCFPNQLFQQKKALLRWNSIHSYTDALLVYISSTQAIQQHELVWRQVL